MALGDFVRGLLGLPSGDNRPVDFPPPHLADEWALIEGYLRRFRNARAEMLKHHPAYKNASDEEKSTFTPVPLPQEMARLSSALLFSAEPKLTNEANADLLEKVVKANRTGEFLLQSGEDVAVQGHGALRLVRDGEVSDQPLVTWIDGNKVVFRVRHGRFVTGGYVVIERRPNPLYSDEVYRLVEDHRPGLIERTLYRGNRTSLGSVVPHRRWLEEFSGLPERTETRLNAPTLYRWNNTPRGVSDFAGLDAMLDLLNEAESIGAEKLRRSIPITFADRKLADRNGVIKTRGVILTGGNVTKAGDEGVAKTVETVQPALQSEDHVAYVEHVRELVLQMAGYSLATWGLGDGGTADSGTALRLRQARTLLTKAGKERSARPAITEAYGAACAWSRGASDVESFVPELLLGDGLPTDPLQDAQVVATKRGADMLSDEQGVRELHPDWDEKAVRAELKRLEDDKASLVPPGFAEFNPNVKPPRDEDDPAKLPKEEE